MASARQEREEELQDADEAEARPGWRARLKSAVSLRIAQRLDRVIAAMQGLRTKVAPSGEGDDETGSAIEVEPATVPVSARIGRPFLVFLIAVMMLLIGAISGAMFSFSLFAQRIESQSDFIANQADEVFESNKDARHAERALEQTRSELKEVKQALEASQAELQQTKVRLSEVEGRAVLYGNKRDDTKGDDGQASAARALTTLQTATTQRQGHVAEGSCELGSGTASRDLSRCLNANVR